MADRKLNGSVDILAGALRAVVAEAIEASKEDIRTELEVIKQDIHTELEVIKQELGTVKQELGTVKQDILTEMDQRIDKRFKQHRKDVASDV